MSRKFAIRPRRYADKLDAIWDILSDAQDKGIEIDIARNPNGKLSLLAWCHMEITRLREKAGEAAPVRKTKIITGPRPVAEPVPVRMEEDHE